MCLSPSSTWTNLARFDADWAAVIDEITAEIHPVDRDACRIWFQFFPLELYEIQQEYPEGKALESFYQFRGKYRLADVADTSHCFLYGHRYWPDVKKALHHLPNQPLCELVRTVASQVQAPREFALPMAAIGLMTLRQAGPAFLDVAYTPPPETRRADDILRSRATDARSGWFSKPKPRVIINEREHDGWFPLVPGQHITTAAEQDKRPYHQQDERCSPGNGPIPVNCRSGSCGTCWVGILGGNENLAPPDDYERKRMEYFGYWENPFHQSSDSKPLIRLACQCVANGSCSVVIPPWNGIFSAARRRAFARHAALAGLEREKASG